MSGDTSAIAASAESTVPLGGERILGKSAMAERIRSFRWQATPLGPLVSWSESLVSTINLVLASPMSTILMAGPALVTLYNDAYIPTLAERHPQALGMRGDVLWADAWAAVGHQIEDVAQNGTSFKFDNVLIPVERNGITTDTWFTYSFSPVFESGTNTVSGVLCMARDVTDTHRAMLDLAESERKLSVVAGELSQVMDATTDSIITIDRDWRIRYMNPAAIHSYAQGRNLIGCNVWQEFPEAGKPGSPFLQHHEIAMYEGKPGLFEAYYPEPLDMWIWTSVSPIPDGIVSVSRNITESKRTGEVLLQTEKLAAVGRLASSIAHEINNPLEAVTNLLYLARNSEDTHEIRTLLGAADDELRRVSAIANQTLAFHKQSSRPRSTTPGQLFSGAVEIYKARLRNAGIRVMLQTRADTPVTVYEGEIRQVLNNLISNAIDAMPRGGVLRLRSHEAVDPHTGERGVMLVVADTGTGIPHEKLTRIFDAFYTTKGIGGTGLGLWISKDIVARHNGTLRVRSSQRPAEHGTVFTIFLPFRNPAAVGKG